MNSIKKLQNVERTLNKSQEIIAGLMKNDSKTLERFLKIDKNGVFGEDSIYKVLHKVLYSPFTPSAIFNQYCGSKPGEKEQELLGELWEKGIFSKDRLATIKAEHDETIYKYVYVSAVRLIQDKTRNLERSIFANSICIEENIAQSPDNKISRFETSDYLQYIISKAKLNDFQEFIIKHKLEEYEPNEIAEAYSEFKHKTITMNYCSAQASLAKKSMKSVIKSTKDL